MNTSIKSALVFSAFFFSMISTAWANTPSLTDIVAEAETKAEQKYDEKAKEIFQEFQTTGGKIVVGRDGSVKVYPNGPTVGQRIVLTAAYVKDGVVWATGKAYNGAKAADGAVIGVVTYPVAKVGEWMSSKPAETKEVAKAEAAPAPKAEVKPETAPAPSAEPVTEEEVKATATT